MYCLAKKAYPERRANESCEASVIFSVFSGTYIVLKGVQFQSSLKAELKRVEH